MIVEYTADATMAAGIEIKESPRTSEATRVESKQSYWLYAASTVDATVIITNAIVGSDHTEATYYQQNADCR